MVVVPEVSNEVDVVTSVRPGEPVAVTSAQSANLCPKNHEGEFLVLVNSSNADPNNGKIHKSLFCIRRYGKLRLTVFD